jgi:hypothetical protein
MLSYKRNDMNSNQPQQNLQSPVSQPKSVEEKQNDDLPF